LPNHRKEQRVQSTFVLLKQHDFRNDKHDFESMNIIYACPVLYYGRNMSEHVVGNFSVISKLLTCEFCNINYNNGISEI